MNRWNWITALFLIALFGWSGILITQSNDETPPPTTELIIIPAGTEEPSAGNGSAVGNDDNGPESSSSSDITLIDPEKQKPLSYDYDELLSGQLIQVRILNKGQKPVTIRATLIFERVFNEEGQSFELDFDLLTEEQNAQEQLSLEVPGEITFLEFKIKRDQRPKVGTYSGFLFIRLSDGSTYQKPLTLAVSDPNLASSTTYLEALGALGQQFSLWLSQKIFGLGLKFGLWDFLFLIIFLLWPFRWGMRWYQRDKLGPVTINKIVKVTKEAEHERKNYGALIQEILANTGLLPHSDKPTPSISKEVGILMKESSLPQGNLLMSIWNFIVNMLFPKSGYTVTGTLWDGAEESTCRLTLNIKNERTGKNEIKGMSANSDHNVSKNSAYFIYCHLMGDQHISSRTPKWARFSTSEGFEYYQRGKKLEKDSKKKEALQCGKKPEKNGYNEKLEALKEYKKALRLEKNNALIYLQMVNVLEDLEEYLEALEILLKVVSRWPDLLQARYRLAVVFSFVYELCKKWTDKDNSEQKQKLLSLLNNEQIMKSLEKDKKDKQDIRKYLLGLADSQWEYLQKELCWQRRVWKYVRTWNPLDWRPDKRTYFKKWIGLGPWGSNRHQFKKQVDMARYCTILRCLDSLLEPKEDLKRQLKEKVDSIVTPRFRNFWLNWEWCGVNWKVRYNAACFYALAIKPPPTDQKKQWEEENQIYAEAAVEQLDCVLRDPEGIEILSWIYKDPDLKNLGKHTYYQNWLDLMGVAKKKEQMDETNQTQLKTLCYAGEILAAGAAYQVKQSQKHVEKFVLWTEVDVHD